MDHPHAIVVGRPVLQRLTGPVSGAVVHGDDLEVPERLQRKAADGLGEVLGGVTAREQYGEPGLTHGVAPWAGSTTEACESCSLGAR